VPDVNHKFTEQKMYDQAMSLFGEVWEDRKHDLDDRHPVALETINDLINLYEAWNKPEKAKKWQKKLHK
jgi:hypothetical protein